MSSPVSVLKNGNGGGNGEKSWPLVIYTLMGLNVLLYFLISGNLDNVSLVPERLMNDVRTSWPRVVSSLFAHANLVHLLFNMSALYQFGVPLEKSIGSAHLIAIYLLSGIGANLAYSATHSKSSIGLVGASGAISGVMAVYFLRFAERRQMTTWLIYQVMGLLIAQNSNIGFSAHLYGFSIGALYYYLFDGNNDTLIHF